MDAELAFTVIRAAETAGSPVVAIANGELWTCGPRGRLAVSHDQGATWIAVDAGVDVDLHGVTRARDGAMWVVGGQGFAARIVGERLERISMSTTADFTGVCAFEAEIIVLANDGTIRRCRDGRIDVVPTGATVPLTGIAVLRRGTLVVVGTGGLVMRSPDGAWFARGDSGVTHDLQAVVTTPDHRVIAVGAGGCVLVSDTDGRTWRVMTTPGATPLRSVAASGSGVLIGGDGGLLLRLAPPDEVPARYEPQPEPVVAARAPVAAPAPVAAAAPTPAPAAKPAPSRDPARVNAGLALSRRALALAPDDAEIQLAHAILLADIARAGNATILAELREQLASCAPAIRERIATQLAELDKAVNTTW
jgi:hypothetical protein